MASLSSHGLTRRRFLAATGATALSGTLHAGGGRAVPRADGPNVVLLVIDTLRADHVGAYGGRALTPNIDALAREGLRFTQAFPEAMATVPARRSIMTGRRVFPFRHWHPYPGLMDTPGWAPIADPKGALFTSAMRRRGYWSGYVTDNPFLGFSRHYGPFRDTFDRFVGIGGQLGSTRPVSSVPDRELEHWLVPELRRPHIQRRVRRYLANSGGYWRDESRSWAARVFTAAAAVLTRASQSQPFALVVDTFEPHEPWTPPRRYIDLYGDPDHRGPEPSMGRYMRVGDYLSEKRAGPVLRRMRDLYAAEVTLTDRWLGVFLDRLHELGLADNTVVALVADHGYLLGDHGWTGKASGILHPPLIQVPLIVVDPRGRRAGQASRYPASTHDVAPTLLSMAEVRRPRSMNGADLAQVFRGERPRDRELAWGGYGNHFYARTEHWSLVSDNRLRRRRLFDLQRDPRERRDVAARHRGVVEELSNRVVELAGGRLPFYDSA